MRNSFETIVQSAESLLTTVFSTPVNLAVCEKFASRHLVLRCELIGEIENQPKSIFIKQMSVDGRTESALQNQAFFRHELACLRMFNDLRDQQIIGPRLYGFHEDTGLLIIADLGEHQTLREILQGNDAGLATDALIQFGQCLGQAHVATIGKESQFKKLLGNIGYASPLSIEAQDIRNKMNELVACLAAFQIKTPDAFIEAIEALEATIYDERNPFRTWTHRDLRPRNILCLESAQIQLVDFELVSYGHALLDAVSVRMAFPPPPAPVISGGKTIPPEVTQRFEESYRTQLAKGILEAADDKHFQKALTQACAHWALLKLLSMWEIYLKGRLSQGESYDFQDDIISHQEAYARFCQQGVAYLQIFKDTAEEYDLLPVIRHIVQMTISAIRKIWPELKPLSHFSAFQNTSNG
jgi:thiamine kinase-like enzyme